MQNPVTVVITTIKNYFTSQDNDIYIAALNVLKEIESDLHEADYEASEETEVKQTELELAIREYEFGNSKEDDDEEEKEEEDIITKDEDLEEEDIIEKDDDES